MSAATLAATHRVYVPARPSQTAVLVARTLRDRWRSLLGWGLGLVGVCVVQLAVYPSVQSSGRDMQAFVDQWPEPLREAFGLDAYSTGPGFLNTELFSLMIPFILIGVALAAAAAATAGEEEEGTADLLLALPVTRGLVLVARALALAGAIVGLSLLGWVTLAVGTPMVDLEVSTSGLAAGAVMTGLLGLLYGTLGLLLGALTGRRAVTIGIGVALALGAFMLNALAPLADWLEPWQDTSPFAWALGGEPLVAGVDGPHALLLAGLSLTFAVLAWLVFRRRDITTR